MNSKSTYHQLTALKNGDAESFKDIYSRYHSLIYFYALKFIQVESMAQEATADVFIALWKKRTLINPELPIQSLLYKIAKDTAYNYLKKIASDTRLKQQYLQCYSYKKSKSGEALLIEKERLARIHQVIENLPPKRLEVFRLRYLEGFDNNSTAQQLGISINTVKVHLAKARLYLKKKIAQEQGYDLTLFLIFLGTFLLG